MKLLCDIYKSSKYDEMYLYVSKKEGLEKVPEALMEKFGKPRHSLTLILTPDKKLARADIAKVLEQIEANGYYLQLPPQQDTYMTAVNEHNSKLAK